VSEGAAGGRALGRFLAGAAAGVLGEAAGPAVVAGFETAAAGCPDDGATGLDGRPASTVHPSGRPLELSVTGSNGVDPVLRYTTEAGSRWPFFSRRLAHQRQALAATAERLDAPAAAAVAPEVVGLIDRAYPDPATVPARTRQATLLGVVHHAEHPSGPVALKVYVNAAAAGTDALSGWPDLLEAVHPFTGDARLRPHFVAAEATADGAVRKAYFRTVRSVDPSEVDGMLATVGVDGSALVAAVEHAGLRAALRRRSTFVCRALGPDGTLTTSVHLQPGALGPDALEAGRRFADAWIGSSEVIAAAEAAGTAGAAASGLPWSLSFLGARFAGAGSGPRLNAYVAPAGPSR